MKTEKPVEYSTDQLTVIPLEKIEYKMVIFFAILICVGLIGAWIAYVSQRITNYEKCYEVYGVLIGVCISVSVKMISVALSVIVEDGKYRYDNFSDSLEKIRFLYKVIIQDIIYRCKKFSVFGITEITTIVMSLLTLHTWFYMTEEDFIMIYGRKCPLQKLILAIAKSFFWELFRLNSYFG